MQIYTEKGKIYKIFDPQTKTEKFQKQELIIQVTNPTNKGTFIEFLRFQCINNIMKQLEGAKKGDFVVCKFKISGRKIGKDEDEAFYTNLDVVELVTINKTTDIIEADKKSKTNSYADRFPGIKDEDDDEDILSDKDIPEPPEEDDLPF
jgi:Domain of unknown function (DUF3127)